MTLSRRDTFLTLAGVLLALFLGALDQTIVSTALPRIVQDLDGVTRYAWVATSYLLASTVLVPIYGKLADVVPRKLLQLTSIGVFLLGSALCGMAGEFGDLPLLGDGMNQLVVFRGIQGLGGAGLFALAFIVVADLFPPKERGRYQGLFGAAFGLSSVIGPLLGGLLTDHGTSTWFGHEIAGWRWIFYVNLPLGAVAAWFIAFYMPAFKPAGRSGGLDVLSALLLIAATVPLVLALQLDRTTYPWSGPRTLGLFAGSAVALVWFVLRSLRVPSAVIDVRLFQNRVFRTASVAIFLYGAAFLSIILFLPPFLVNVVGVSATRAGVSVIPLSLGLVFGAVVSGQLVSRIGRYKGFMLGGGLVLVLGAWLLSTLTVDVSYGRVTVYMVVCGLGIGPSMPLYTLAIQNSVDRPRLGQATSASQFLRQIGQTVGAGVMGAVFATTLSLGLAASPLAGGGPPQGAASGFGGASVETMQAGVEAGFRAQEEQLEAAVRSGSMEQLDRTLAGSRIPEEARAGLRAGAAAAMARPEALEPFLARMREGSQRQGHEVALAVVRTFKESFAAAIAAVYKRATILAVLALLATLLIPDVPLRATFEAAPEGVGA
jgi:EmrB/QacA subfamily drug resistance transporter